MKQLKYFFLATDIGFLLYWLITALHLIPDELLFQDYKNEILVAWNWSFLPLDLLISFTGLTSIYCWNKKFPSWQNWAIASLLFTFCSGLQAIAFWVIRRDFDPNWWIPNLFLLIYPLFFLPKFLKK